MNSKRHFLEWRSGPSSRGSNFGAAALTVGAVAAVGGRGLLLQRRATAVKKKGVRVVEGKEKAGKKLIWRNVTAKVPAWNLCCLTI